MTLDVKLAMEKFRLNGGLIKEDSNGELVFSFLRAGDLVPKRYWRCFPPLTPDAEQVYSPFFADAFEKRKQKILEHSADFLQRHPEEAKEIWENEKTIRLEYNELTLDDMIDVDTSTSEKWDQYVYNSRLLHKRAALSILRLDFMRRDPQFIAAYNQVKLLRKKAGPYINERMKEYSETAEGQMEAELCQQFEIAPPFPPPDLNLDIKEWRSKWRVRRFDRLGNWVYIDEPTKPFVASCQKGQPHLLTLEIDLSQGKTRSQISREVSAFLKDYMAQNGLVEDRNDSERLHPTPEDLENILTAGRLYQSPGATYQSVMFEVSNIPGTPLRGGEKDYDNKKNYQHNYDKVKKLLKAYREITEGEGWRKIGV
jgi:hypothetical protein